jgi:hypothetical protein
MQLQATAIGRSNTLLTALLQLPLRGPHSLEYKHKVSITVDMDKSPTRC